MEDPRVIKTLQIKLEEMFQYLHIPKPMGNAATHALHQNIKASKKPMVLFAHSGLEYFKTRMNDTHAPILISVFCLLFSQTLFDPKVGCLTITDMDKEKGKEEDNGKKGTKDISK